MKKLLFFATFLFMIIACDKERYNQNSNGGTIVLRSSIIEPKTKVSLSDDGASAVKTVWEEGDEIAVKHNETIYKFVVSGFEDETHKIALLECTDGDFSPAGGDLLYAWYPYSANPETEVNFSGQDGTLEWINQEGKAKTALVTLTPSAFQAHTITYLNFEHITSIIKLNLKFVAAGSGSDEDTFNFHSFTFSGFKTSYSLSIDESGIQVNPGGVFEKDFGSLSVHKNEVKTYYFLTVPDGVNAPNEISAIATETRHINNNDYEIVHAMIRASSANPFSRGNTYVFNKEMDYISPAEPYAPVITGYLSTEDSSHKYYNVNTHEWQTLSSIGNVDDNYASFGLSFYLYKIGEEIVEATYNGKTYPVYSFTYAMKNQAAKTRYCFFVPDSSGLYELFDYETNPYEHVTGHESGKVNLRIDPPQ